jgi:hypothetical protein
MRFTYRQIKYLIVLILVAKLFSPLYGQVYFSEVLGTIESGHEEFACLHDGAVPDHESQERPRHIIRCYEIEQPGLIISDHIIHYTPAISSLVSVTKSITLPGYDPPIDIPPKYHS